MLVINCEMCVMKCGPKGLTQRCIDQYYGPGGPSSFASIDLYVTYPSDRIHDLIFHKLPTD